MNPMSSRTKQIDDELRQRFGRKLRAWTDAEHGGNGSAAARALGISQSHMSAVLNGVRGVGLPVLLLFAEQTGQSLDAVLGLTRGSAEEASIREILRKELAAIRAEEASPKKDPTHHAKPLRGRPAVRRGLHE